MKAPSLASLGPIEPHQPDKHDEQGQRDGDGPVQPEGVRNNKTILLGLEFE